MNEQRRKQLEAIFKDAADRGIPVPADVLIKLMRDDFDQQINGILKTLEKILPERLPLFTLSTPGIVPAPRETGLILYSTGWGRQLSSLSGGGGGGGIRLPANAVGWLHNDGLGHLIWSTPAGGGGVDHSLLLNLDYASSGHTGFSPAGHNHAGVYEPVDITIVRTGNANWIDLTDGGVTNLHSHAAGGGDVVGPAGATDGNLAVFDTATGKLLKDGGAIPVPGASVADLGSTAETVGGVHDDGVAATAARSDHKHEITNPKLDDLATPDNNTDLDSNTTNHGLLLKATAPAAGLSTIPAIENGETVWKLKALFDNTNPEANGAAAPGTSLIAARRDHVHTGGAGDVVGPAGATDGHLAVFDGATGKLIKDGGAVPGGSADGWTALGACTYEASDDPTYTFSFASDMTTTLSAGMRIKLTDSGIQYFIITAVGAFSGGKTIITGYGGTDYNLSGGAITDPYYSMLKAPFGFPLNPIKWTVEVTDVNDQTQNNPVSTTWYNLGGLSITVPIGAWYIHVRAAVYVNGASPISALFTLSTANNSESDIAYTIENQTAATRTTVNTFYINPLILTTKTVYYLNESTVNINETSMILRGTMSKTILRAVCAYL